MKKNILKGSLLSILLSSTLLVAASTENNSTSNNSTDTINNIVNKKISSSIKVDPSDKDSVMIAIKQVKLSIIDILNIVHYKELGKINKVKLESSTGYLIYHVIYQKNGSINSIQVDPLTGEILSPGNNVILADNTIATFELRYDKEKAAELQRFEDQEVSHEIKVLTNTLLTAKTTEKLELSRLNEKTKKQEIDNKLRLKQIEDLLIQKNKNDSIVSSLKYKISELKRINIEMSSKNIQLTKDLESSEYSLKQCEVKVRELNIDIKLKNKSLSTLEKNAESSKEQIKSLEDLTIQKQAETEAAEKEASNAKINAIKQVKEAEAQAAQKIINLKLKNLEKIEKEALKAKVAEKIAKEAAEISAKKAKENNVRIVVSEDKKLVKVKKVVDPELSGENPFSNDSSEFSDMGISETELDNDNKKGFLGSFFDKASK